MRGENSLRDKFFILTCTETSKPNVRFRKSLYLNDVSRVKLANKGSDGQTKPLRGALMTRRINYENVNQNQPLDG